MSRIQYMATNESNKGCSVLLPLNYLKATLSHQPSILFWLITIAIYWIQLIYILYWKINSDRLGLTWKRWWTRTCWRRHWWRGLWRGPRWRWPSRVQAVGSCHLCDGNWWQTNTSDCRWGFATSFMISSVMEILHKLIHLIADESLLSVFASNKAQVAW